MSAWLCIPGTIKECGCMAVQADFRLRHYGIGASVLSAIWYGIHWLKFGPIGELEQFY